MANILAVAFEGHPIRVTDETPKRAAIPDVIAAVGYAKPHDAWALLREKYPELIHQAV
jgi:hypothetical protein